MPHSNRIIGTDPRLFRVFMILAGVLVPLFGVLYVITDPTANDPWWMRISLSILALAGIPLTIFNKKLGKRADLFWYAYAFLLFIWLPWLLLANSLLLNYVLGFCMAFSAVLVTFRNNKFLIAFILFVFIQAVYISYDVEEPETAPLIFSGSVATIALASYFAVGDRNRIQVSLQKREEHYRALIENAADIIALVDKEGKVIYVSPAIQKILGFSPAEFLVTDAGELMHPDEIAEGEIFFQNVLMQPGLVKPRRLRMKHKNGNYVWLEGTVTNMLNIDSVGAIVTNYRDVTEKIEQEQEIKLSNQRYELVSRATSDAIWDWNLETGEIYWNEGYKVLFGYDDRLDMRNIQTWSSRIYEEDRERITESLNLLINDPKRSVWEEDYRYYRKSGEVAYVFDRGYIIHDEKGKPIRLTGAMQDVTSRKLAEIEKTHITSDLIQRNSELEQFAYIVSHNLRGPVSNIIGISEALKNDLVDPEDKGSFMDNLYQSILKLDGVIRDLNQVLGVKKEFKEQKEVINFEGLVTDILASIKNIIDSEKATITWDFKEVPEMKSLKSYMHSIFQNLIVNSIKYRKSDVPPDIHIQSLREDDKVKLIFTDNGSGIDLEKNKDQVFNLYKRFHTHIEGKGMGLFMVKTQVEALDGKIFIESEVNKGTTFTIELNDH